MALFILSGNGSSFSKRFYMFALIVLILVHLCSYCSSSFVAPVIDVDPLSDDIDEFDNIRTVKYYVPFQSSASSRFIGIPEQELVASNGQIVQLLLKLLSQSAYQNTEKNDKRYITQSFHAMRG